MIVDGWRIMPLDASECLPWEPRILMCLKGERLGCTWAINHGPCFPGVVLGPLNLLEPR
jgi:hypothetical protein